MDEKEGEKTPAFGFKGPVGEEVRSDTLGAVVSQEQPVISENRKPIPRTAIQDVENLLKGTGFLNISD